MTDKSENWGERLGVAVQVDSWICRTKECQADCPWITLSYRNRHKVWRKPVELSTVHAECTEMAQNGNSKTQVVEDLQSLQEPIPKAMVHGVLTSLSTVKPSHKCNYITVPYVFCYYSLPVLLWNLCWLSVESLTFHLMPPLATSSKGWVALTWLYLPLLFLLLLLLLFLHQTSAICTLFETVGSSQEFSMNDPFEPRFDCNSSAFLWEWLREPPD